VPAHRLSHPRQARQRSPQTLYSNHNTRAAEQKAGGSREKNENMPQGSGTIEQRKVKAMQPVNQPSVEATTPICDGQDLAGSSVDLNPCVRAIIEHDASRRIREGVGTHPVSIICRNGLNSKRADR
jgi:hypothetical protein